MHTNSFVLSVNTRDISKDLRNIDDLFNFSNLIEKHELLSKIYRKVIGEFIIETP